MMAIKYKRIFILAFALAACGDNKQKLSDAVPAKEPAVAPSAEKPMDNVSDDENLNTDTIAVFQNEGNTIGDFIPDGFALVVKKEGDLNDDSLSDAVIVVEPKNGNYGVPRTLAILFKTKAGTFILKETSSMAYAHRYDGLGQEISKFDILDIHEGQIIISQYKYGYQWNSCFIYEYDGGNFPLVSYSNYSAGAGGSSDLEYDFEAKTLKKESSNTMTLKTTVEPEIKYTFDTIPTIKNIDESALRFK